MLFIPKYNKMRKILNIQTHIDQLLKCLIRTIVVAGSPPPLLVAMPTEPILALMATRSIGRSKYGLKQCDFYP